MKKCYTTGAITMAVGAVVVGGVAAASALEIQSGNDKVALTLYGHINRAVMSADDGNENKIFHVDNTHSESRIGLKGKVEASDTLTIGSNFELQWQANPSEQLSMEVESISGEFKERIMEVYFDFDKLGKFSIGRGDMASDDTSEVDLSGTDLAGNSGVADAGGGFAFYDAAPIITANDEQGGEQGLTVGDVFNQMDGLSRRNRLRYDTPTFAGFSFGAAGGEKERADASLIYSDKFSDGTKLKAAIAYSDPGEGKEYTQINGSASVLFGFGLNLTVAGGSRDLDDMPAGGEDPAFMYGKVGYKTEFFSIGSSALSCDYGVYKNIKNQDAAEEGTAYGVQLVQRFSAYSTDLYAAYRNLEVEDNTSADYEPISIMLAGARIKF
ncbi:MAG: porin [Candidatus Electrothrix sp. AR4]|nr:porin [Candidatus Electrothrix sp. AR4]